MEFFSFFVVVIIGLVFGSFLTAVTYRLPRGKSFLKGRSFCPHCNKKINWYDNIPIISYFLLLRGKCRNCGKKISSRYPIIEFVTAILFLALFYFFGSCAGTGIGILDCYLIDTYGFTSFFVFPALFLIFLAVFISDFETKLIPDALVFTGFIILFFSHLLIDNQQFYEYIFYGFFSALLLLSVHLLTRGKGMGLGDVKLALLGGFFFGYPHSLVWLFTSFLTGAIVGSILVLVGKARFGKEIPFGPFLVLSFFLVFFWGERLTQFFLGI